MVTLLVVWIYAKYRVENNGGIFFGTVAIDLLGICVTSDIICKAL